MKIKLSRRSKISKWLQKNHDYLFANGTSYNNAAKKATKELGFLVGIKTIQSLMSVLFSVPKWHGLTPSLDFKYRKYTRMQKCRLKYILIENKELIKGKSAQYATRILSIRYPRKKFNVLMVGKLMKSLGMEMTKCTYL